jgi:hypothetical protein
MHLHFQRSSKGSGTCTPRAWSQISRQGEVQFLKKQPQEGRESQEWHDQQKRPALKQHNPGRQGNARNKSEIDLRTKLKTKDRNRSSQKRAGSGNFASTVPLSYCTRWAGKAQTCFSRAPGRAGNCILSMEKRFSNKNAKL